MNIDNLDTLDLKELGHELALARKKKGLTQEEAAKLIGVARTTLTAIEKGERRVKAGELIKLAREYGRQISDFVRPRPKLPSFRDQVQFRGPFNRTEEDDNEINPYIDKFEDLCRDFLELEDVLNASLRVRYPTEYILPTGNLDKAAESIAIDERHRLGLGDAPIPLLRDILEQDVGLRVFFIPMHPAFSEMYFYSDQTGGCLAINQNHPEDRRRWSMCHGYAHFLTNRYEPVLRSESPTQFQSDSHSDRFADAFSLYFLAPTTSLTRRLNEIRQQQGQLSIADILRLAHRYGLAVQAVIRRLEDMRELPSGYWGQFKRKVKIKQAQEQLGLEVIPGRDDILPLRYRQLAFDAFNQGLIAEGKFAQYLRVSRMEARSIAESEIHENEFLNYNEQELDEHADTVL